MNTMPETVTILYATSGSYDMEKTRAIGAYPTEAAARAVQKELTDWAIAARVHSSLITIDLTGRRVNLTLEDCDLANAERPEVLPSASHGGIDTMTGVSWSLETVPFYR
jgi:hypothetical protein